MHHKNQPMEQVNCIAMHHIKRFASRSNKVIGGEHRKRSLWVTWSIHQKAAHPNPLLKTLSNQLKSLHIDSISECFFINNLSLALENHLVHMLWPLLMSDACVLCAVCPAVWKKTHAATFETWPIIIGLTAAKSHV